MQAEESILQIGYRGRFIIKVDNEPALISPRCCPDGDGKPAQSGR